jgi:predicted PurR-regulated permease PerM
MRARKNLLLRDKPEKGQKNIIPPSKKCPEVTAHISAGSVVRAMLVVVAIVLASWIIIEIKGKIILLLLATFLAVVIDPSVQAMQRIRIPRSIAVLLHFVAALFVIVFLLISFIPIIADQLQQLAIFVSAEANIFLADPRLHIPLLSADVNERLTILIKSSLEQMSIRDFAGALERVSSHLSAVAGGSWEYIKSITGSVATFVTSFIVVLVLTFFMQLEKEKILRWFRGFLPGKYRPYVNRKLELIHSKIGQWARGEALLMFSIFTLTLIALVVLRMPYALTLAVLAGFCEFVPAVGPLFAAIPAVLIGFTQGGLMWGLVLIAVYYVIQWCENNLLVPIIMKRAVGLSSIAILFAFMVGISFPDTIHPVLGVMLCIPATTIITIFLEDLRTLNERHG